jgi:hypothetical protein
MIRNFTEAEWSALTEAVAEKEVDWEQNGDAFGRRATSQIAALNRAYEKARQLAPSH